MEAPHNRIIDGRKYNIMVFSLDGELYWRVKNYKSKKEVIAKELQNKCGYPIEKFGFSDFGVIDNTAYWESREQSTYRE